jgi:plasmid stabilization system protein ParE
MSAFVVAPEAEDDTYKIWRYLLKEAGLAAADRVETELLDAFAGLAKSPGKGHRRPDLTRSDVLFYTLYQFMVVYRLSEPLQILAVLHAKRNVKRILKDRL